MATQIGGALALPEGCGTEDAGKLRLASSMAKLYASDVAMSKRSKLYSTTRLRHVKVRGTPDGDAKITQIYEGTSSSKNRHQSRRPGD